MRLRLQPSSARLRAMWRRRVDLTVNRREPGFLKGVPYVLILRFLISIAVITRFLLHKPQYYGLEWALRLGVSSTIFVVAALATIVTVTPRLRRSYLVQSSLIAADIALLSSAYFLTNNPESDFFLFYYLPMFSAVEYLNTKRVVFVFIAIALMMGFVVIYMHPLPREPLSDRDLMLRVLLPRWLFFLGVVLSSAIVFRLFSRRQAELEGLLSTLHMVSKATPKALALDGALEGLLFELTGALQFDLATISIVDEYRNCVECIRGRNVPPGWIKRARHDLDSSDIQARIVRTRASEIVEGWDEGLDADMYRRFGHERYVRLFTPIISPDGSVVGTIEAGCTRERRSQVLTSETCERVRSLADRYSQEISDSRSHVVLRGIVNKAIDLIGADSATLHVYRRDRVDISDKVKSHPRHLILAVGAGKATPSFVRTYQPGPLPSAMLLANEPQWLDEPQSIRNLRADQVLIGVSALAVIPLTLEPDIEAMLGVQFWGTGQKRFTSRSRSLAELFAREMEVILRNFLQFKNATDVGGRSWALAGLQGLTQSLTSPFHLPDVLRKVAANALLFLDADNITLYQFDPEEQAFVVPPVTDGTFITKNSFREVIAADDALFALIKKGRSQFIENVSQDPILGGLSKSGKQRFAAYEQISSCAVLLLRPEDIKDPLGLLFVNFRSPHHFDVEEQRVMDTLSTSAGLAIRTARLHRADVSKQLEAMHAVHTAIARQGPDLKQVMERLLEKTVDLTGAHHGLFMRYDPDEQRLDPIAEWPVIAGRKLYSQKLGEGIIGLVAESKKALRVNDVTKLDQSIFVETIGERVLRDVYKEINTGTLSELAVPLLDEGARLQGVLNVEHQEVGGLNEDHEALLERLAVPAIIAIHTVELYRQHDRRLRHLSCLNQIAARVQSEALELDTVIRLFLTGITVGEGLGFSRCMIFLREGADRLRGRMALGSMTRREAEDIWQTVERGEAPPLADMLLLAEGLSGGLKGVRSSLPQLDLSVQAFFETVDSNLGAVAECLLAGRRITRLHGERDAFRGILARFACEDLPDQAFACVPLIGKQGRGIGVLLVDNKFLDEEKRIDPAALDGLEAFARLLAVTIENVRLQERMAEDQAAGLVHTVEKRVGLARNSVPKLRSCIARMDSEHISREMSEFVTILEEDLQIATRVFKQFRTFSSPKVLSHPRLIDLRALAEELIRKISTDCTVVRDFMEDPAPVRVDRTMISNALVELTSNAEEAMSASGKEKVIRLTTRLYGDIGTPTHGVLEILDSGPGIPEKIRETLFEPFVTADKIDGTGLGLANARRFIELHGGSIKADLTCHEGARFIIRLPLQGDPQ